MTDDAIELKLCKTCGEEKPLELFPFDGKRYRYQCRPCFNAYAVMVRHALPPEKKEEARVKSLEYAIAWAKRNPERKREIGRAYAARNREKIAEYHKQWSEKNREKCRGYLASRRAKQASATVQWDSELTEITLLEAHHLASLRLAATGMEWHVDHIVPIKGRTACGLHVWTNFQVIPAAVNLRKSNKVVQDSADRNWL